MADFRSDFDSSQDRLVFANDVFKGLQTGCCTTDGTMVGISIFALLASEFIVQTTRLAATVYDIDDGLI